MMTIFGTRRFVTLIATATLISCTTINPYTGQQQTSRAVQYGAAGAVGCGAIGAGVGANMDAQEREMREQLAGTGVQVVREGDRLELGMPGNVTFPTNEYTIRESFYPVLDSVSEILFKYTDTRIRVVGHTDSTGSLDYNYGLSDRRARSVGNYLAGRGVDQNRIITEGVGPDRPIASNDSDTGRAQNRRVELEIVAVES